jgi:hypothetical protein
MRTPSAVRASQVASEERFPGLQKLAGGGGELDEMKNRFVLRIDADVMSGFAEV